MTCLFYEHERVGTRYDKYRVDISKDSILKLVKDLKLCMQASNAFRHVSNDREPLTHFYKKWLQLLSLV